MSARPSNDPKLPNVGDAVKLFGVTGTVTSVEAFSDWAWSVEVDFGDSETSTFRIPTDYRTDDGEPNMSADQRGTRKALGLIEGQHVTISRNGRTVTGAVKVHGGNSWSVGDRRFGGATIVKVVTA